MKYLIQNEFLKLFSKKMFLIFSSLFALLVFALILFLRIFASGASFGNIMQTSIDSFSIFAVIIGAILTLVSYQQEVQQKTLKNLLVCPIKRPQILIAKLLVTITVSFAVLFILWCVSFVSTTLLFGFFTEGNYSSAQQNMTAFFAALTQLISAFFTSVFYNSLILFLLLLTNSLAGALVGTIAVRGIGELIARSLLDSSNALLGYSPLGVLNILNPITNELSLTDYSIQLILLLVYSFLLFYCSCKLFERKEF